MENQTPHPNFTFQTYYDTVLPRKFSTGTVNKYTVHEKIHALFPRFSAIIREKDLQSDSHPDF